MSAGFTDNESAVTGCEYTRRRIDMAAGGGDGAMTSFTCVASGIVAGNGQLLRLNMRATSDGGTAQGATLSVTVDTLPPTGSRSPGADPRTR